MYQTLNPIDEQTPIPIESAYFLEDGERDKTRPNRFYFKFPEEWITSNRGESIVGVRNIWTNCRRRKLCYTIGIRKYYKKDFDDLKRNNPKQTNDFLYYSIPSERRSEIFCDIISWLPSEKDLREIIIDLRKQLKIVFEKYNVSPIDLNKHLHNLIDKQKGKINDEIEKKLDEAEQLQIEISNSTDLNEKAQKTLKRQNLIKEAWELSRKMDELEESKLSTGQPIFDIRDVGMDGYYNYEKNTFIETFYSPLNEDTNYLNKQDNLFYIDFSISFRIRPFENGVQDNSLNRLYDFADIMNVGYESFQNNPNKYMDLDSPIEDKKGNVERFGGKWMREIVFEDVWDRCSCKIYSSIAEQSSKGYLGNSKVQFSPIKYFKLNSSDNRFWIEFYSGRYNRIPVKIPETETFYIEMQFMPFNKKLMYV